MTLDSEKNITEEPDNGNKQWPQWIAVFAASLNYFSAGICFLWSSPSLVILQSESSPFPVNNSEASWIAAFLPIGCAVGPLIGSCFTRYVGPKNTTIITTFPYIAGFIIIMLANSPTWLYCSRFLSGFAVGFGQIGTPIYISEIAENRNRGALLSFFTLTMGIGAVFITLLGPYFTLGTMALISMIFPVLLLVTMLFMPDSPYYYVRMNKEIEAEESIKWLRRQKCPDVIQEEMRVIKEVCNENISIKESFKLLLKDPNPKGLAVITTMFLAQSFCGAIVVMFFQEQLYEKTEVPIPAEIAVMITLVISNISGFLSVLFVDRWGRRPLLITSTLGCAFSTATIGTYVYVYQNILTEPIPNINWIPIVALNTLQIFFYFGLSPIPTTQLGELFCSNVKEIAFCLGFMVAAVAGVVVTKLYQIIEDTYGTPYVFWGMSLITCLLLLIMLYIVPETKEKSFLEIKRMLSKKDKTLHEAAETYKTNLEKY